MNNSIIVAIITVTGSILATVLATKLNQRSTPDEKIIQSLIAELKAKDAIIEKRKP